MAIGPADEPGAILSGDTSVDVERLVVDRWRTMSSVEIARLIGATSSMAVRFTLAGLRDRHPDASDRELFLRLAILRLGPVAAAKVYPEARSYLEPA